METRTQPVGLSRRLLAIVEMAGEGDAVCDVGCDHAHVPIRLLQEGRFSRAIGMDLISGPLEKAAGNLKLYGMEDSVELRLSDGLDAYRAGEADTLVITGMGGTVMESILLRDSAVTGSFSAMVLGPQSDPDKVRAALRVLGFTITDERLIYEDGKYYPVLRAVRTEAEAEGSRPASLEKAQSAEASFAEAPSAEGSFGEDPSTEDLSADVPPAKIPFSKDIPDNIRREAEDLFGPVLLAGRDPVLHEYLVRQKKVLEKILKSVREAVRTTDALRERHLARQREIEHSLTLFSAALTVWETGDRRSSEQIPAQ